jgi:dienelactone hydrolase
MREADEKPPRHSAWVDHVPVLWIEPREATRPCELALLLPNLAGTKEQMAPYLEELAADGFVALSFDPWQHGERGTESKDELAARVFGAFRRHMWPILGQTTLDALRVIDWAVAHLGVARAVRVGGLSMGGDVVVALAGLDRRVRRVGAVVATPDWLRPGMHDPFEPGKPLNPGAADAYASQFYDLLNPLTHLERYYDGAEIRFFCGELDTHVPPDGAQRFQAALRDAQDGAPERVSIRTLPGLAHMDVRDASRWWPDCHRWLASGPLG